MPVDLCTPRPLSASRPVLLVQVVPHDLVVPVLQFLERAFVAHIVHEHGAVDRRVATAAVQLLQRRSVALRAGALPDRKGSRLTEERTEDRKKRADT